MNIVESKGCINILVIVQDHYICLLSLHVSGIGVTNTAIKNLNVSNLPMHTLRQMDNKTETSPLS